MKYKVVKVKRKKYETKGSLIDTLDNVAMIVPWDTGHEELRRLDELEFTGETYEDELIAENKQLRDKLREAWRMAGTQEIGDRG